MSLWVSLRLQCRNTYLAAKTQWPSLAHSHNTRDRGDPHRGGWELDPEGMLCRSKRQRKALLAGNCKGTYSDTGRVPVLTFKTIRHERQSVGLEARAQGEVARERPERNEPNL